MFELFENLPTRKPLKVVKALYQKLDSIIESHKHHDLDSRDRVWMEELAYSVAQGMGIDFCGYKKLGELDDFIHVGRFCLRNEIEEREAAGETEEEIVEEAVEAEIEVIDEVSYEVVDTHTAQPAAISFSECEKTENDPRYEKPTREACSLLRTSYEKRIGFCLVEPRYYHRNLYLQTPSRASPEVASEIFELPYEKLSDSRGKPFLPSVVPKILAMREAPFDIELEALPPPDVHHLESTQPQAFQSLECEKLPEKTPTSSPPPKLAFEKKNSRKCLKPKRASSKGFGT